MNRNSKITATSDEGMKYKVGDVVCYPGYEKMKSQHYEIVGVINETHPFFSQKWYVCKDCRGIERTGLAENIDQMVKLN